MSHPRQPCLVIVPMKDPSTSKTRLSARLSPSQRHALARLLFTRTLGVLRQVVDPICDVAVLTASSEVTALAKSHGAQVIPEPPRVTLSSALDHGADWAATQGYGACCILPGDIAAPDPHDIGRLIALGLETGQPVLCPAHDLGTNGFFLPLPAPIRFAYGAKSALRHHQLLEAAGLTPIMLPLDSLRLDIDTAQGLDQAQGPFTAIRAGRAFL